MPLILRTGFDIKAQTAVSKAENRFISFSKAILYPAVYLIGKRQAFVKRLRFRRLVQEVRGTFKGVEFTDN